MFGQVSTGEIIRLFRRTFKCHFEHTAEPNVTENGRNLVDEHGRDRYQKRWLEGQNCSSGEVGTFCGMLAGGDWNHCWTLARTTDCLGAPI